MDVRSTAPASASGRKVGVDGGVQGVTAVLYGWQDGRGLRRWHTPCPDPRERDTPTSSVQVCADHRGGWEVELPDDAHVSCQTLAEARALALRYATQMQPCDLVVRDAYDRVLQRQLVQRPASDAG